MKLTDYLKRKRLTQAEFGLLLNPPMSQAALSHVINGRIRISLERALEIQTVTSGEVAVTDWVRANDQREVA